MDKDEPVHDAASERRRGNFKPERGNSAWYAEKRSEEPRGKRKREGAEANSVRAGARSCPPRSGLVQRRVLGSATPGWRKVALMELGPCRASRTKLSASSASSASRIGRRRILAGSSVAMPANWDENRISAVLRTTTQIVLSEILTINIGSLRFSRRRVTYPRPSWTQVFANKRVTTQEVEAAGIAPASRNPQGLLCSKVVASTPLPPVYTLPALISAQDELVACWHLLAADVRQKDRGNGAGPARFPMCSRCYCPRRRSIALVGPILKTIGDKLAGDT